ncbi:MAG: type II toxin-antitoxin system RelE/ParE family toxin [Bifidobacteriaceae bacterium]|jgi:mRNA interferase RelE/StbE|nr:type II toxin-antitoxin system RelE/ParE family toxin [Bifidobacteriaceae bacterium]
MEPARWRVEYSQPAAKAMARLDKPVRERIYKAMDGLAKLEKPQTRCETLKGAWAGLWRLRAGNYRVVVDILAGELTIVAVDLGHRSRIYGG